MLLYFDLVYILDDVVHCMLTNYVSFVSTKAEEVVVEVVAVEEAEVVLLEEVVVEEVSRRIARCSAHHFMLYSISISMFVILLFQVEEEAEAQEAVEEVEDLVVEVLVVVVDEALGEEAAADSKKSKSRL